MKKTKILYIHHGTGIGGAPISLINLILALDKSRFEAKVVLLKDSAAKELFKQKDIDVEILGIEDTYFAHHEKGKTPWWNLFAWNKIYKDWKKTAYTKAPAYLKRQSNFDIVHINSDVLTPWAVAAHNLGFKVVCHNRDPIAKGVFGFRRKKLQEILGAHVHKMVSISEDNKLRLGLPQITSVAYNFILVDSAHVDVPENNTQRLKVLYVGGQASSKGFHVTVNALEKLNENVEVWMAGNYGNLNMNPKGLLDKLKYLVKVIVLKSPYAYIAKMKSSQNVQFLGLLSNSIDYIKNCDVLISPFTIPHFSRPIMEAYACGKPVVVSDIDGMSEIVQEGVTGYLIPNNDSKALAECLNRLADERKVLKELGRNGGNYFKKVFAPEKNIEIIQSVYEDILINHNDSKD